MLISTFPATQADDTPDVIPSPFANRPHPLAEQAARLLQQRLSDEKSWPRDFFAVGGGKMFGVLVVKDQNGALGYLSAFSGMLNGLWYYPGFVPPLFDQLQQDRLLPAATDELNRLAEKLEQLSHSKDRTLLIRNIADIQQQRDRVINELKQQHKEARAARKTRRAEIRHWPESEREREMAALALASQHHKREMTQVSTQWKEKLQSLQKKLDRIEDEISRTSEARTVKLRQLHQRIYATYLLSNALHEQELLPHFFKDGMPPAGAGDCAGPKLLHYARHHDLTPVAMAEFWWGASPSAGIRHHGHFYPACRGKCRPILPFMLRGLEVEPEPEHGLGIEGSEPKVIYEDENILVVNKPAGLMSAPGKYVKDSAFSRLQQRYPDLPELRLVHRLDMGTSGILLLAKNLQANKQLQRQFIKRSVEKRYEAILSKPLPPEQVEGEIDLPLCVDLDDTPRQMVSLENGKPAKTRWQVIKRDSETTRIWFYPQTGRTHQLRIHASHEDGLNAAIVGDELYGLPAERMMLHAERLSFNHPVSRKRLTFEVPAPF